ncbi:MAG: MCE family protein [Planctomycetales bacterium]|nr:MCE family protein [Planctomycetales bacterium]
MDEQGYRFGVGVLVVASMVIAVILILFFGAAPNLFKQRYEVTIRFDAAPMVTTDTPVRKNGVQIGRVKSLELLDDAKGVDLTLELDSEYRVRAREQPRIGMGNFITNEAVVEFVPPTRESLLTRFDGLAGTPADGILDENENALMEGFVQDGDYFTGGSVAPDPLDALVNMQGSVATTLTSITSAVEQVNGLASDIRGMLGGGNGEIQRIAEKIAVTIDNLNMTLNSVNSLVSDPSLKSSLDTVARELPRLADRANQVMEQADASLAAIGGVGTEMEKVVRNIGAFTEPLGENGDEMVADLMRTVNNFDQLITEVQSATITVNRLVQRVNNGQGTLARLLDDDQAYVSIVNTLGTVEDLARRLTPIIADVRVLADKAARDPSVIVGLRGALLGRPAGVGIK